MNSNLTIEDIPAEITKTELLRLVRMSPLTLKSWIASGRISPGKKVFSNRVFTRAEVVKALRLDGKK